MSRVAFYAPLKSPNHPTPSGDRQIARALMGVLERALGQPVTLASELRSLEKTGDAVRQDALVQEAEGEIARLVSTLHDTTLWVSYHNYYKAPDLIGPAVARALNIPYVLIEATRARKRLTGPWAGFAARAEAASDAADVIFHFTNHDRFALARDKPEGQQIAPLPPFLDRDDLPTASTGRGGLLSVAMMRPGDKLSSYTLAAEALSRATGDWQLDIVGDGTARAEVEALFTPFGTRVRFHGALGPEALGQLYGQARALLWPGVNEAFGMVYLEAQAHGVPIIAQDRPGVREVLAPGVYPAPKAGTRALAKAVDALYAAGDWTDRSDQAATYIETHHLRPAAVERLSHALRPLIGAGA